MVPKETSWKGHASLCVPSPGTVFSCGYETSFGSCSRSLGQGQVNCSLRLKIKLSSQPKNTKHWTKKRKPMEIQLLWEMFLLILGGFSREYLKVWFVFLHVCICMNVCTYVRRYGIMDKLLKGLCIKGCSLCLDQQTIKLEWGLFLLSTQLLSTFHEQSLSGGNILISR